MSKKTKLAYILAASHSGSTLLARVLACNSAIYTVGELKLSAMGNTDSYVCSCRKPISECEFWSEVARKIVARGGQFSLNDPNMDIRDSDNRIIHRLLRPMHRGAMLELVRDSALALTPGWYAHKRRVQRANALLISTLAEVSDAQVIVDSSKVGVRLKYLLKNPELDVFVLRLIRDGRGVALTYIEPDVFADASDEKMRRGGRGTSGAADKHAMLSAANEWARANAEAEAIIKGLPANRVRTIKYEDLCESAEKIARGVAEFLQVESEPGFSGNAIPNIEAHIVGNGMRFDQDLDIRHDDRWVSVLTAVQLKQFESAAGIANRRYGYM